MNNTIYKNYDVKKFVAEKQKSKFRKKTVKIYDKLVFTKNQCYFVVISNYNRLEIKIGNLKL